MIYVHNVPATARHRIPPGIGNIIIGSQTIALFHLWTGNSWDLGLSSLILWKDSLQLNCDKFGFGIQTLIIKTKKVLAVCGWEEAVM